MENDQAKVEIFNDSYDVYKQYFYILLYKELRRKSDYLFRWFKIDR